MHLRSSTFGHGAEDVVPLPSLHTWARLAFSPGVHRVGEAPAKMKPSSAATAGGGWVDSGLGRVQLFLPQHPQFL